MNIFIRVRDKGGKEKRKRKESSRLDALLNCPPLNLLVIQDSLRIRRGRKGGGGSGSCTLSMEKLGRRATYLLSLPERGVHTYTCTQPSCENTHEDRFSSGVSAS